jgi:hypothetical protein
MDSSRSFELFREAVLDLNDRATAENARRYLAASRLLEQHRREQAAAVRDAQKPLTKAA